MKLSLSGIRAWCSRLASSWGSGAVDTGNLRGASEAFGFASGRDGKSTPTTNPPAGAFMLFA